MERLPIRAPLSAGPLSPAIQGLLRRDPVERVPESVVREALTRILKAELDEDSMPTETLPIFRDLDAPQARRVVWGKVPLSRPVLLGGALAVTVVCFAGLTAAGGLSERGASASGPAPSPRVSATPSPTPSASPSSTVPQQAPSTSPSPSPSSSASASPSPSRTVTEDPPAGFFRYTAPQGFSVELPKGWQPVRTENSADGSYRVTLGASGDPRTLVVTYSTRLTSDPVAVWREVDTSARRLHRLRTAG